VKEIRTRFAPSPTGYLHIGGIRTALFSWLYARHSKGSFILRIEDTDKERSTQEAVDIILNGMAWLDLKHDEGPYYQSQHTTRYQAVIDQLLTSNDAYYCYCSKDELDKMRADAMQTGDKPRYDGRCRNRLNPPDKYDSRVVRFKNPESGVVVVNDLIQGKVEIQNSELDDLIIARSDGVPTYNLTVVVDDMDMNITHVIRGDDHLNNTPKQINIFSALGAKLPEYAHIPLILDEDGKKLSKRQGAASVLNYREQGILPEALLNYLVRLGWSHGDKEIFSIEEMIELFDLVDINKSAAAINPEKLIWLNQHYLRLCDSPRLVPLLEYQMKKHGIDISNGPALENVCEIQKERVKTLDEMAIQSRFFYEEFTHHEEKAAKKHLRPVILQPLLEVLEGLSRLETWTAEIIHNELETIASRLNMKLGKIAQPVRVAVTGGAVSPSIDVTLTLIGKNRVLNRLEMALGYIRKRTQLDSEEGVT
jgi:glutamyl-tRNA synthetase